ncbi:MAG: hypothetical protein ACLP4V_24305 [Methylocella sp.]
MKKLCPAVIVIVLATCSFAALPSSASAQCCPCTGVGIHAEAAPPPLPYYDQPPLPAPGYMWTPGYWAWNNLDYYWVPGTWVEPPRPGLLWTPGYWGFVNGLYVFNQGYWGPHVGFYGGISYGFGYGGSGYQGGRWNNGAFFYNSSVNNVGSTNITNVYNEKVVTNNVTSNNTSFNGGKNGTVATPTVEEEAAAKEPHEKPTNLQAEHTRAASMNTASFASTNHGKPAVAATARPGAVTSPDVIKANATDAPVTPPPAKAAVVPAKKPLKTEPKAEAKPAVEKPAKVAEPTPNVSKPKVSGPTVDKPAKVAEPTPSVRKPKVPGPALQKPKPDKPKCGEPHEPACH